MSVTKTRQKQSKDERIRQLELAVLALSATIKEQKFELDATQRKSDAPVYIVNAWEEVYAFQTLDLAKEYMTKLLDAVSVDGKGLSAGSFGYIAARVKYRDKGRKVVSELTEQSVSHQIYKDCDDDVDVEQIFYYKDTPRRTVESTNDLFNERVDYHDRTPGSTLDDCVST